MTDDFIKKLMVAKQVMDKTNDIPRGGTAGTLPMTENFNNQRIQVPELYSEQPIPASYNIPQEYMEVSQPKRQPIGKWFIWKNLVIDRWQ